MLQIRHLFLVGRERPSMLMLREEMMVCPVPERIDGFYDHSTQTTAKRHEGFGLATIMMRPKRKRETMGFTQNNRKATVTGWVK